MTRPMRRAAATFHRDQQGMMSLVNLVVLLGFLVLFGLLANIGQVTKTKVEAQNAADGAAAAAGTQLARGMNMVTAAQHLIGEFHALVVLVHALGGDPLDDSGTLRRTPGDVRESVDLSYNLAVQESPPVLRPWPVIYNQVRRELRVNGAIGDARVELKKVQTWAYIVHAAGGSLATRIAPRLPNPYAYWATYIAGVAIIVQAMVFETKVGLEWVVLDGMEASAVALNPFKQRLRDHFIPAFYQYVRDTRDEVPRKAEEVARVIGDRHETEGTLFPAVTVNRSDPPLALPLEEEPRRLRRESRSQLVRASTPWVQYWRLPILRFGERALLLARFKAYYARHTQDWQLELARRMKAGRYGEPLLLYLIPDADPDRVEKGDEPWTKAGGSRRADELFGTIAFARRSEARTISSGIYRRTNPDGQVAFAQTMIYNGNPQRGRERPDWQPVVGWDALNWGGPVPEYEHGEPREPDVPLGPLTVPEPRVRVDWREKLVPTTRLADAVPHQTGALGAVLRRTAADTALANTH